MGIFYMLCLVSAFWACRAFFFDVGRFPVATRLCFCEAGQEWAYQTCLSSSDIHARSLCALSRGYGKRYSACVSQGWTKGLVIQRGMERRSKKAGFEGMGIRPYDIRHVAASEMLANGADLAAVSAQLGHSSVITTGTFYAHVTVGSQQKASTMLPPLSDNSGYNGYSEGTVLDPKEKG